MRYSKEREDMVGVFNVEKQLIILIFKVKSVYVLLNVSFNINL